MIPLKLTNTQTQKVYHIMADAQFECENSKIFNEMQKIIADDPYKNTKFSPTVDAEIIGFYINGEISSLINHYEIEAVSNDPHRSKCTTKEMVSMIELESKTETYSDSIRKRAKILILLAMEIGIWEDKMEVLADKIDCNDPQAVEALCFYEDAIIREFEAKN